jgi:glucosamine--fructose-6-phosphate aminotransferase (isomerizing)
LCGITGFIGKDAGRTALEGLRSLEYRGYDSAGIAFLQGGKAAIVKTVGDVAALEAKMASVHASLAGTTTAISHTRWATHGGVTDANAHPHADCTGKIAIIHNGIIENFQKLREELQGKGHAFRSQTDTEVISHLIEEYAKTMPFDKAGLAAVQRLSGSYAILAICADKPEMIVAAKNESPLVIATGKDFTYFASDPYPILPVAREGVFLEDGDYAVATRGTLDLFDISSGKSIRRPPIGFGATQAAFSDKKQYAHFMLKEIMECPQAITTALVQDDAELSRIAKAVKDDRIVFVACGTSRHASLVGRYLFNRLAGKFCEVVVASEFPYIAKNIVGSDVLVVAVSQSGETADVIEGVKIAKANGAKILSITNVVGSTLDRMADYKLHLNCGPEVGVAATKTFVAQLTLMYLLAAAASGTLDEVKADLREVAKAYAGALEGWDAKTKALAGRLCREPAAYFIARGPNFPTALEGALKFKEITYIHAEGMAAGELKHGTLALVS